jgi:uncharacterized protein
LKIQDIYALIPEVPCLPGCTACCQAFPYVCDRGCTIYPVRPFICRLFGAAPNLLCHLGARPLILLHEDEEEEIWYLYRDTFF